MAIRPAAEADLPAVLEIVNREIREGVAHFGSTEHTLDDLHAWLAGADHYPFLVAVDAGRIAGYARASRWKDRQAYDWAVEIGVYIDPGSQGRGHGRALYDSLLPALVARGYRSIIAGIALPNPASVRLHEACGMTHIGTFPQVGYKHGRWIDVGYWVVNVGEGPPRPISAASS